MTSRWPGTICGVVCGVLALLVMLPMELPIYKEIHLFSGFGVPIVVGFALDEIDFPHLRWLQGILAALFLTFSEYFFIFEIYYATPVILNIISGAIIGLAVEHPGRFTFRRREGRGDLEE